MENIYIWKAEPNERDEEHSHSFNTRLRVISGEIIIGIYGQEKTLLHGDVMEIPKNVIHWAKAGGDGCEYEITEY
jgi:quercetin dioxygenase-like cupin family protein